MADLSQKELNLLAYTLLGEAAGEGREGMEAVMWTIRNRAESGRYSDNPASVATQKNSKGVYQYSAWNTKGGGGNQPQARFSTSSPEFKEALAVAQRVMAGEVKDPTGGATHFYAEGAAKPYWFDAEGPAGEVKIGNHRFAARNTADTAARAAEDLATGSKLAPRPQSPVVPARRPDTPTSSPSAPESSGGGLSTRSVTSVAINPNTGMPHSRLPAEPTSSSSSSSSPSREATRLSEIRTNARNVNDQVGAAARVSTINAAASDKQSRNRDLVNEAARTSSTNAAAVNKTSRNVAAPQAARPAVTAQNKSVEQIGREADNARLSGYRSIQEAGPSSKGAPAKPVASPAKTPGVVKTAGTTLSDGTRLQPAGEVQLPRNVKPQINTTVTTFIKPAADPRRLPVGTAGMKIDPSITMRPNAQQNIDLQRNEQAYLRKSAGKKTISIKSEEPTIEQVVAVRDLRKGAKVVGQQQVRSPIVLSNGVMVAQPQMQSVAAMLAAQARQSGPAYTATQWQQDNFQFTPGTTLSGAMNNDRWTSGYETAPTTKSNFGSDGNPSWW